jgi:rubrerythrin
MKMKQVQELVLQSLEHEIGGVKVYETAVTCAVNAELKEELEQYLEQTRTHVTVLEEICRALKIDPQQETPGRKVVRTVGQALVDSMKAAKAGGDPASAEIAACEAVVLAETKDHMDWELLGKCAEQLTGSAADTLKSAYEKIEEQEDEHLYHSRGWCRELWMKSLGMTAVLPPPEERRQVKTAIGAARAEQAANKDR